MQNSWLAPTQMCISAAHAFFPFVLMETSINSTPSVLPFNLTMWWWGSNRNRAGSLWRHLHDIHWRSNAWPPIARIKSVEWFYSFEKQMPFLKELKQRATLAHFNKSILKQYFYAEQFHPWFFIIKFLLFKTLYFLTRFEFLQSGKYDTCIPINWSLIKCILTVAD